MYNWIFVRYLEHAMCTEHNDNTDARLLSLRMWRIAVMEHICTYLQSGHKTIDEQ